MEKDSKAIFFNNRETEIGLEGLPCLIRAAKKSYLKSSIAFGFQKNSPYTKMFSHVFLKMMESGQVQQMYRKHLNAVKSLKHRNDICSRKVDECMSNQSDCVPPVSIMTVCSAGLVAIIGIVLGGCIVIGEIWHKRRKNNEEPYSILKLEFDTLRWKKRSIAMIFVVAVFLGSFILMSLISYVVFLVSHSEGNINLL